MLIALLLLASPANQTCTQASTIAFPSDNADSTLLSVTSTFASPCGQRDTAAVWFTMVTPTEGRYEFRTKGGVPIERRAPAAAPHLRRRLRRGAALPRRRAADGRGVDLPRGRREILE